MRNKPELIQSGVSDANLIIQRTIAERIFSGALSKLKKTPLLMVHDEIVLDNLEDAELVTAAFEEAIEEFRKELKRGQHRNSSDPNGRPGRDPQES